MATTNDEWPDHAVPVDEAEIALAIDKIHRLDAWACLYTRAALTDDVHALFGNGWNILALRRALVESPDGAVYDGPPAGPHEVRSRWAAWAHPPVQGYELGTALAAQFGRDNDRTIRDDWAPKAVPANPLQAFRAARWMRFMYGWSTYASLKALAELLTPWFSQGWCPAAIAWAIEHRPNGNGYPARAQNLEELKRRLGAWRSKAREDGPPIVGGSWETIVAVRRRRLATERPGEENGAFERWQAHQALRDERWKYKRSVQGVRDSDAHLDFIMYSLDPRMPRLEGPDVPPVVDGELCSCGRHFRLPGRRRCTACVSEAPGRTC